MGKTRHVRTEGKKLRGIGDEKVGGHMGGGGGKGSAELSSKDIHYCCGSSTKLCHLSTH